MNRDLTVSAGLGRFVLKEHMVRSLYMRLYSLVVGTIAMGSLVGRTTGPIASGNDLAQVEKATGSEKLEQSGVPDRFGMVVGSVLDAATGLPTPCTVRIVDAEGRTVTENPSFGEGFRCPGKFTKRLPAGRTQVLVTRGFETRAVEQTVDVPAGGQVAVKLRLERVVDLRKRGWYGGDSHAHMIHGERTLPVEFDFVALTAQAEDLQYLSLAQAWTLTNPTPERLEAELQPRSTPQCVLTWNLEAPKNYYRGDAGRCLGHCWMVGTRGRTAEREDVIRVLLEASAHDYQSEKAPYANFESHQLIHAQGGSVFYTHPARWWTGAWGGQGGYPKREKMRVSNMAVEMPLDTLLGPTFDGLDVITGSGEFEANAMAFELWSLLLNHGYRLAGTASSDACFDRPGGATPGVVRTYTLVENGFSLPGVARAAAQGRNFATSGPLLLVSLADQPPGAVFPPDGRSRTLRIEAWASGTDPKGLSRLELLRNGRPFQTILFSPMVGMCQTNLTITEKEDSWYCIRAFGSDAQRQRAISGAFFFASADRPPPPPVPARVHIRLRDAETAQTLNGVVTELAFHGTLGREGKRHGVVEGEAVLTVPATVRLRAEVPGYVSQTQSPFLDHPELVEFITGFSAEDLLKWETFERVRALLGNTELAFALKRTGK